jgi:hypothetical protein
MFPAPGLAHARRTFEQRKSLAADHELSCTLDGVSADKLHDHRAAVPRAGERRVAAARGWVADTFTWALWW